MAEADEYLEEQSRILGIDLASDLPHVAVAGA